MSFSSKSCSKIVDFCNFVHYLTFFVVPLALSFYSVLSVDANTDIDVIYKEFIDKFETNVKKVKTLSFTFEFNNSSEKRLGNINYDLVRCRRYERVERKKEESIHLKDGFSSVPAGIQLQSNNSSDLDIIIREIVSEKTHYLEGHYDEIKGNLHNPYITSRLHYDEKYIPQEFISSFSIIFGEIQTGISSGLGISSIIQQFKENSGNIKITEKNNSFILETNSQKGDSFMVVFSTTSSVPVEIRYKKNPQQTQPMQIQSVIYIIKKIENISGIDIPTHYTEEIEIAPGVIDLNGQKIKTDGNVWKGDISLKDISVNKSFSNEDFKFFLSFPDYTGVYMQDVPQIKYIWLKGKVVPWTDELALAQARGHGFIPGVREPRFWLMAAGLIMIVCALTIKIRRYYLENGKGGK